MLDSCQRTCRVWLARAERWAVPGILLAAFALRLYRLGDQNIWWDEGLAIWAVRKTVAATTLWTAQDVHPPLYFWGLWAWVRVAGEGEFAARFLSVIWGLLTVAVTYALGTRLGGRRVGSLGALFLAVSRFHVWWSQEMRMYILATLAVTVTLYGAVRWLEEERDRPRVRWLLVYVLGATSSLYTIYLAALGPLVANLYAAAVLPGLPASRRWRALARWSAAQAGALLLLGLWLLIALPRMHSWSVAQPFGMRALLSLYASLLAVGVSTEVERHAVYALPFAAAIVAGLSTLWWARRRAEPGLPAGRAALLLTSAVASLPLLVYLLTRPRGLFYAPRVEARYLVLFGPAFCLLVAWSVVRLARRSRPLALPALAACLGLALAFLPGYYSGRYMRDELQTMVRILGAYTRPGDRILLISGDRYPIFCYYYERLVPADRRVPVLELPQGEVFTAANVGRQLEEATAGRDRFWIAAVEARLQDPEELSLPWLDQRFRRAFTYQRGYNALILYGDVEAPFLMEREAAQPEHRLGTHREGGELLGYDLPARECRPGDAVDLGLYWAAGTTTRVEVQWRHEDGQLLQTVSQEWPATGQAVGRSGLRFRAWPWYGGGRTRFVVRWPGGERAEATVSLPGPRILAPRSGPLQEQISCGLDITLDSDIHLLGFDVHRATRNGWVEARAGQTLVLDLFWQAARPVERDYTVFTHLVGSAQNPKTGGPLWAQHDGPPVGGEYATSSWVPGQLIHDRHVLPIDAGAPAGDYELEIGLYDAATQERLRVQQGGGPGGEDRVVVVRVRLTR